MSASDFPFSPIDEFWKSEDRLSSGQRIYGQFWRSRETPGAIYEFIWIANTKEGCLGRHARDDWGIESAGFDLISSTLLAVYSYLTFRHRDHVIAPGIAVVSKGLSQEVIDQRLEGWQTKMSGKNSVRWLLRRLYVHEGKDIKY